jgi:hypothetical protein
MKITAVGIDLAKNVFQVHGVDERGKAVLRKELRRTQIAGFFGNLPPCVIGMEADAQYLWIVRPSISIWLDEASTLSEIHVSVSWLLSPIPARNEPPCHWPGPRSVL